MGPLRPSSLALLAFSATVSPVHPFLVSTKGGPALNAGHTWARGGCSGGTTAGPSPTASRHSAGLTVRYGLEEGAVMFMGEEVSSCTVCCDRQTESSQPRAMCMLVLSMT